MSSESYAYQISDEFCKEVLLIAYVAGKRGDDAAELLSEACFMYNALRAYGNGQEASEWRVRYALYGECDVTMAQVVEAAKEFAERESEHDAYR